jgi:outer membrane protein OmpU
MMKKLLLGSTALIAGGLLAAPAMAADPIKIGVGGYYQFYAIAGNVEGQYALNGAGFTTYKGLMFSQEGEVHFIGQTKLDNGTTIGLTLELESWNVSSGAGNRQIDEAFMFAFGDWGRLEFGSRDPAAYRMYYGAPSALLGFGFFQHNSGFAWTGAWGGYGGFNKASLHVFGAAIGGQVQDTNRVNYYTPRFMGLQIGVGYAPKWQPYFGYPNLVAGGGQGTCGYADATALNNCPTADYSYQDVFDIGANYLNKFGDITLALHGAFMYASFVPGYSPYATAANLISGSNATNWKQWVVGAQIGYGGFTLGGSIGYDNNGRGANYYTGVDNDTRFYNVSLMYQTGPWQMSVGWVRSYNTNGDGSLSITAIAPGTNAVTLGAAASTAAYFGTNPVAGAANFGEESGQKFEVGVNYALGPGVKLFGGGLVYSFTGPSNAVAGKSWGLLLGMDLRF